MTQHDVKNSYATLLRNTEQSTVAGNMLRKERNENKNLGVVFTNTTFIKLTDIGYRFGAPSSGTAVDDTETKNQEGHQKASINEKKDIIKKIKIFQVRETRNELNKDPYGQKPVGRS
ncbi:MAG: hypothetical protein ACP5TL_02790 [Candidatus Micrarchaeia archaeon]